jgi:hypothetical protein
MQQTIYKFDFRKSKEKRIERKPLKYIGGGVPPSPPGSTPAYDVSFYRVKTIKRFYK